MPSSKHRLTAPLLWVLAAVFVAAAAIPWVRPTGNQGVQNGAPESTPESGEDSLLSLYGASTSEAVDLARVLFGIVPQPIQVATPNPTAEPSPPVQSPAPRTDSGLRVIGTMTVEGVKKWVFSDSRLQTSFVLGVGDRFADWAFIAAENGRIILRRDGVIYGIEAPM